MNDAFPRDAGRVDSVGDSLSVVIDCVSLSFYKWLKHPDEYFCALWGSYGKSAYQITFLYLVSDIKCRLTEHSGLINWLYIRCH